MLLPLLVGVVGSAGVGVARHNLDAGASIVAVAAIVAVACAAIGEHGAAVAAIGVAAAAAFVAPDGLGPLLVLTGVVISGDIALVSRGLARWRYVVDALVCVPALGGLAATIAAQPSHRAIALAAASAAAVAITWWRNRNLAGARYTSPVSYLAAAAAVVVALAPDRVRPLGDLPPATLTAARSVAAALAVFVLTVVLDALFQRQTAA